ncbi:MAG: 16S rRNA (cytosine(1402)-N(4))-methyltransferase RsmH [Ruminococcaceae bacterium]|nr:16S rRNA (cytosine(1402)-N(4))-methyltransferase RsmH [Oscillospiraceae bacterium]
MDFAHITVLLSEAVDALEPERGGVFVDCTAGGGGHSEAILKRLPQGSRLISLDRDERAVIRCRERLEKYGTASCVVKTNYSEIGEVLDGLGIDKIDGVLWDLGVSSVQLDERERGFSYSQDAPLDMRMDRSGGKTAADVVNTYSESELCRIIRDWGEEKFFARVSSAIVKARQEKPIETTVELADIITNAIPAGARKKENQHPAKRTFQAIRIEVNDELNIIEPSLRCAVERLAPGGRAAVITFHSLEDRITKQTFKSLERPCTCPSDFPVCVCGKKPQVKLITKKPTVPSEGELEMNPRARSAKLRVVEKL